MFKFIFKGLLRDKRRSVLPVVVVSIGVFLTVFMTGWLTGVFRDMIDTTARFTTGHVRIMTNAFAENESQNPNDLALLGVDSLMTQIKAEYPEMDWISRINFGGLIDIPDNKGETRAQGQAVGLGVDLFTPGSTEIDRLNIRKSIVKGRLPLKHGEALISDEFAARFNVKTGDDMTLFGTTMNGSIMFSTFKISGTVRFGSPQLDRGAVIIDISDARESMDMQDGASVILGFSKLGEYNDEQAMAVKNSFNARFSTPDDEFAPVMKRLRDDDTLDNYLTLGDNMSFIMILVFVAAMSIVLWNTGLLGGLRRYTEFGIRLALGEEKSHIYSSTLYEAILIGVTGSLLGTLAGVGASWYLQEVGIDLGNMLNNSTMMLPQVFRAQVSPKLFFIGFIPGTIAMVLGNALAGYAIYKRKTARLFKELEV
ncbi:MAG TPA: FtsX-like permease family protein [Lentimicrobium sp.]|nr:FtsX-like permease family protein [Lentimicrobium sp.]